MADFPIGVSAITWEAVSVFAAPAVAGSTTTLPDHVDFPADEVGARSVSTLPRCADGAPFSFELRGSLAIGAGFTGVSIGVGDPPGIGDYVYSDNLAAWLVGSYEDPGPFGPKDQVSVVNLDPSAALVEFAAIDNTGAGVETTGTAPVAFVLAWDYATQTRSLDWGAAHYETTGVAWQPQGDGIYHVGLRDQSANSGFPELAPPHGPWDARFTDLEIEVFATTCAGGATAFSVRGLTVELCGPGPCP